MTFDFERLVGILGLVAGALVIYDAKAPLDAPVVVAKPVEPNGVSSAPVVILRGEKKPKVDEKPTMLEQGKSE